jgi:hypothetical protein
MSVHFRSAVCGALLALAIPVVTSAAPITDLFSTGLDASGTLLPNGGTDPHWTVISSPTISGTPNFYNGSAKAYYITAWTPTNQANSQWISMPNGGNDTTEFVPTDQFVEGAVYEFVPQDYVYQTTFTLPADFVTAEITGRWVADNEGIAMKLNGATKPFGSIVDGFQTFSITDGFVAGSNTLSFDVRNLRQVAENFNPTGMQVQLSGTYAVPEPTGMGLAASGLAVAGGLGIRRRFLSRRKPDQLPA